MADGDVAAEGSQATEECATGECPLKQLLAETAGSPTEHEPQNEVEVLSSVEPTQPDVDEVVETGSEKSSDNSQQLPQPAASGAVSPGSDRQLVDEPTTIAPTEPVADVESTSDGAAVVATVDGTERHETENDEEEETGDEEERDDDDDEDEEEEEEEEEFDDRSKQHIGEDTMGAEEEISPAELVRSGCHLDQNTLLASLMEVQQQLADEDNHTNPEFLERLAGMVTLLNADMANLKAYCERAQTQLESISDPIKTLTDKIFKKLPSEEAHESKQAPVDAADAAELTKESTVPEAAEKEDKAKRRPNLEELELVLQHKKMQQQLVKINDGLLRMGKIAVETDLAVLDANMTFVEAVEVARQIQEELDAKRKEELAEIDRLAELERLEQARLELEELKRIEDEKRELEEMRQRECEAKKWPIVPFIAAEEISTEAEFNNGIYCLIRADPMYFNPTEQLKCNIVELTEADFVFVRNEELVSHVIQLTSSVKKLKCGFTVWIPHCLSRQQASTREIIMKIEVEPGQWEDVPKFQDVTVDGYKEMRFAMAKIHTFRKLAVVSRFKRDSIRLSRRAGRKLSKVDPRVTLTVEEDTFTKKDYVVLQMQPVDVASLAELRREMPEALGLLCASSLFHLQWSRTDVKNPLVMTLPIPINPVTLKKMVAEAAARAAKETKPKAAADGGEQGVKEDKTEVPATSADKPKEEISSNIEKPPVGGGAEKADTGATEHDETGDGDDEKTSADHTKGAGLPKSWLTPVKWFMGQYAKESDDDRDILYFLRKSPVKQRWVVEPIQLTQVRLDTVEITLKEAISQFIVLRTTILVNERDIEKMMDRLDAILSQRLVNVIVKQRSDDMCMVRLYVVPTTKLERVLKKLSEEGYVQGPEPSATFMLHEGDRLDVAFRGNVVCAGIVPKLTAIYTSNIDTVMRMEITESDIFVQESYDVYRGFIQIRKVIYEILTPEAIAAKKETLIVRRMSLLAKKAAIAAEMGSNTSLGSNSEQPVVPSEDEIPEPSPIEVRNIPLAELLITYPKDLDLLSAKPLNKIPVIYMPYPNEPVTEAVLNKLANSLGSEWEEVATILGIKRAGIQMLTRNGTLLNTPMWAIRLQMLMMWVKTVAKSEDKTGILCAALAQCGRNDLCRYLEENKKQFEVEEKLPPDSTTGDVVEAPAPFTPTWCCW